MNQFKIFCYSFYFQLGKEISKINYSRINKLYASYNPDLDDSYNNNLSSENNNKNSNKCIVENIFKSYNKLKEQSIETFYKLNLLVKTNFIVPLMSSTERVVDMVLSVS